MRKSRQDDPLRPVAAPEAGLSAQARRMDVEAAARPGQPRDGAAENGPQTAAGAAETVGRERLLELIRTLEQYKAGKARLDRRIVASENWWKLRNAMEADRELGCWHEGYRSQSGWLHNVLTSKHADAMEAFPEPNILPREQADQEEAARLSAIVPCILEQNGFEEVYSKAQWQKLKTGTCVYKVIWDSGRLNGLGDVVVRCVNLLNLFWLPGICDIQDSPMVFHTELVDDKVLEQQYPQLAGQHKGKNFYATRFLYDDKVDTSGSSTVIDCYYKVRRGGRTVLHFVKFVGDVVLESTENRDPDTGLYDHGLYPFVFDALFPVEGYPDCGYGYVDLCKSAQIEIDMLQTAMVKNARACATPRYFFRRDGDISREAFLDPDNALVEAGSSLGDDALRQIVATPLDDVYISALNTLIQELRETSGNTETATGSTSSGVTAASAIAALQEASGKTSRDATLGSYRAYTRIVNLVIELIRQFYQLPRQFRIVGQQGQARFISYSSQALQPQHQGRDFGQDTGYRLPVFDIKVSAQKKNVYTKMSQNELAMQLFGAGFFNPQLADQVTMCLQMMDFDGRDELLQKVSQQGAMWQQLQMWQQLGMQLLSRYEPEQAARFVQPGQNAAAPAAGKDTAKLEMPEQDSAGGAKQKEHGLVRSARERSQQASQPAQNGRVIRERSDD